ncbi:MAG: hypothetical protein A3C50_01410 [Candidatus Staskawiczbacteria bacterium RIFCSPHIGHO2_02_FULL_43_16]|uniref:Uncharacterized protein n=1 Tax=Candidatus Staskawiczbacteria bacterium RIFCSPHIGHO2_01_FULL_41_41 TaxID=1802203 RepID=A0A1G2HSZ7_9BACT|nr:MAG: hypothetical protein A2822_02390 [Candidatus Staskawiczbacteria bacterium RIFCSPHIGHO2_01_FULL_41_41]OGZ69041.1 MAG: hypothetical protein A3C50_01410 [Candidatus Staskawiczbacteria bacterium RIFCSPHIGHO2_02_FULL_43_16]OGZ74530.1 MAG: hypothetical protein A3A12_02085 [Candidatus Staskawiczbacteria bacterium RIFCSPLOWO2_01_FULL_43_17b]
MLHFIKFEIWPWVKVKTIYYWWIIKYGGKKNIPRELIFQKLQENMESMTKNIVDAVRVSPENQMDEEEKKITREILMKVSEFERKIKNLK